ncbi:MAG: biotin/lipoyl-binding protein [Chloroflexi bacterium]|nr:biotin/lipoyl-binding protein [Chloroflexota bacterium]
MSVQTTDAVFIDGSEHALNGSGHAPTGTSNVLRVGPGHWHAVIGGRSVEVVMEPGAADAFADGAPTKFHVRGRELTVQIEDSRARTSRLARARVDAAGPVSVTINAPMPGRVLAIAVKVGMTVGRGDVVAVLEAMKMESSITATHSGIVSEILIEAGQAVTTRQALVRISG